ncbi:MAG: YmdB family metallophosphoesterase [Clostridiales bacterium]|nr:YmdB family metallophosphoesterase [Clostridiales bacterium]
MNILAIGDIVSPAAIDYLEEHLWAFRKTKQIDFVIANAENASTGNGLLPDDAQRILYAGADLLTGGNHIFRKHALYAMLEQDHRIIRPANLPARMPGCGYTLANIDGYKVLVINVLGRVFMDPAECPFDAIDAILSREEGNYDFAALDIHAESTSEKIALARYFDGRIAMIFGTHTHVATADEQILPNGSGYITDLGFSGVQDSILGVKSDIIINRYRTHLPARFDFAAGTVLIHGALFDIVPDTGRCQAIERVRF